MKRYVGLLSEVKDLTQKNQTDVDAYVSIAKKYQGKILELGSGSGNISVGLAKEGYDVTCLEIHRDMIHLHEEKLKDCIQENTTLVLGDMCSFNLNEKFDLIIAAQNVIHALKTSEEMHQMLVSVKNHLSDVGVFVIECEQPNLESMKRNHDKERINRLKNPRSNRDVEEKITSLYNFEEMTRTDRIIVTEFMNHKIKRRIQVVKHFKLWMLEELRECFKKEKLHLMLESGSISDIQSLDALSPYMVFFLKK